MLGRALAGAPDGPGLARHNREHLAAYLKHQIVFPLHGLGDVRERPAAASDEIDVHGLLSGAPLCNRGSGAPCYFATLIITTACDGTSALNSSAKAPRSACAQRSRTLCEIGRAHV